MVLVYGLMLAAALRSGTDPQDLVHVGRSFATRSQASRAISGAVNRYRYSGETGYDGQFFFFIAVDPINARAYLDDPAYRYTRIGYPLVAGALGRFDPGVVPWTLLLVNLAMVGAGVLALAAWLGERRASPWLAAVYGFYPGILIAIQRDTSEIMAYGLVAAGVYLAGRPGRRRLLLAGAAFGLAVLTREVAGLFVLPYAAAEVLAGEGPWRERVRANWRAAGTLIGLSFLPLVLLKAALLVWLGSPGFVNVFTVVPFAGVLSYWPLPAGIVEEMRTILVPAVICGVAAAWTLLRRRSTPALWALLLNVVLLVILLGPLSWVDISSSGRVTIGVALAAVLCAAARPRGWFWASAALWLSPMLAWMLLPTAGYYLALVQRHAHL